MGKYMIIMGGLLLLNAIGPAPILAETQVRYHTIEGNQNAESEPIRLEGTPLRIQRMVRWLNQIAAVPKGLSTLKSISQSGHQLVIQHAEHALLSAGRTLAPMSVNLINGKGENVTIRFNADIPDQGSHKVYDGKGNLIAYTAVQNLFHELAHAMHMMKGTWRYFDSEKQAIEEENHFRRQLAQMEGTPVLLRFRKTGVLIISTDKVPESKPFTRSGTVVESGVKNPTD